MIHLSLATVSMALLAVACIAFVFLGLKKALAKTHFDARRQKGIFTATLFVIVAWLVIISLLTVKGFFADFSSFPPRPLILVAIPVLATFLLSFTQTVKTVLLAVPKHWLVYFQSFRIAVEIVLWMSFIENIIPVQMTFEGRNFDIVSGILSLPVGWYISKHKSPFMLFLYNLVGFALLLNIIIIAVLSMPTSHRYFLNEPANTIVATFPFVYLPGVLVVLAAVLHILSFRQMWLHRKHSRSFSNTAIQLTN